MRKPFFFMAQKLSNGSFSNVKTWLTFVGYGRSGHSFIGSILDAHPNVCVAHEADAMRRSESEFQDRDELFRAMYQHNQEIVSKGRLTNNRWGDPYKQALKGQVKNDPKALRVLGNKNGSIETGADKELFDRRLQRFESFLGNEVCVKLVAVLRNPFDAGLMDEKVFETVQRIKDSYVERIFVMKHEEFIANPRNLTSALLRFLDVPVLESHLSVVAESTFKTVHRARFKIEYTEDQLKKIQRCINSCPVFSGYTYES